MSKWTRKLLGTLAVLFLAVGLAACGKKEKSDKIQIAASFYPMYEFTKEVAGDHADVFCVVPAGQEVHDYEPSARDMAKLSDSDVIIYNNNQLEKWLVAAKKNINDKKTEMVEASKNLALLDFDQEEADHADVEEEHDHDHDGVDPHTWLSLKNAMVEVQTIADALSDKYPDYKEDFQHNAAAYIEKLKGLDAEYTDSLTNASNKKFVVQHAAFGYLARDYGLTQIHIAGLTPDAEPSGATLAKLKKLMKEDGLDVVYFEENADAKIAKTLAKEADATPVVLNTIEGVTSAEEKKGVTYISLMEENLENLKKSIK